MRIEDDTGSEVSEDSDEESNRTESREGPDVTYRKVDRSRHFSLMVPAER